MTGTEVNPSLDGIPVVFIIKGNYIPLVFIKVLLFIPLDFIINLH